METSISYSNRDFAYISSDEKKWIDKVTELKAEYPDCVDIVATPEENDGCIYAKIPVEWIKIKPKRKLDLTEEQRQGLREHMLKIRKNRTKKIKY